MKTFIFLTFLTEILIFNFSASSQNGCPNADFSFQDFTNWQGFTGTYNACCPTPGIVPGRHTIMNVPGTDHNTGNLLSILPPGLSVGARLGNQSVGAEAERLVYSFTIDSSNAIFYYWYAVVLEDPSHSQLEQPKFNIELQTSGSSVGLCGSYYIVSGGSIPGFQSFGSIRWKDWALVGIDLSPFIGQSISFEFTTYDCAQSGHFGYAYLSCGCMEKAFQINYEQNFATLTAPEGFTYLWSPNGDTSQSITAYYPIQDTIYSCVVTSVTGCTFTLNTSTQINPNIITLNKSNVYPNPTNNKFFIKIPETNNSLSYSYTLYGVNNQVVIENKGKGNELEINTSNIAKGNYILIIQTSTRKKYKSKIIVN